MTFEEVKSKLEEISASIMEIEEKDFDDIKDVELQESFIRDLQFDYCVGQKYQVDGFPFVHLQRVENREPGYDEDYLTWERIEYYLDRLALEKEDVFELRSIALHNYYPDYTQEELKAEIRMLIKLAEQEKISFDLTPKETEEATKVIKLNRPKWPG